ncbi:MAG: squalene/phytoene synthase family protein [Chthoniobacterales bacterium]
MLYKFFLKKVARSFYLTICFLPNKLREPIALAYLLARASDIIADVEIISKDEEKLLHLLPSLLENLRKQSAFEEASISKVWLKILEGQIFECDFFSDRTKTFTPEQLDHYLYLVAGSVGEFWTELSSHFFNNAFLEPTEKMMRMGAAYGKGLQLINILRDRYEDEARGFLYYEESQFPELVEQTKLYLDQAKRYVHAINNSRLRYASALPVLLAEKTLSMILKKSSSPNYKVLGHHEKKIKVSRITVYATLIRALFF